MFAGITHQQDSRPPSKTLPLSTNSPRLQMANIEWCLFVCIIKHYFFFISNNFICVKEILVTIVHSCNIIQKEKTLYL